MEGYRMGLSGQGKTIWVDRCCFCRNNRITERCDCGLGLPATEACRRYECCLDVSGRVNVLLKQLKNGYGKPR